MSGASIKVEVMYDVPAGITPAPPQPPSVVEESVADVSTSSLEATGDEASARSKAEEPAGADSVEQRQRTTPVPPGCKFTGAKVTVTVKCANGTPITVQLSGNVSVGGHIDGKCVVATSVNQTTENDRTVVVRTLTKRACCEE